MATSPPSTPPARPWRCPPGRPCSSPVSTTGREPAKARAAKRRPTRRRAARCCCARPPRPKAAARDGALRPPPASLGYSTLAATVADSTAVAGAYTGFVDVTAQVAAAGFGEYTVADVQSGTGEI